MNNKERAEMQGYGITLANQLLKDATQSGSPDEIECQLYVVHCCALHLLATIGANSVQNNLYKDEAQFLEEVNHNVKMACREVTRQMNEGRSNVLPFHPSGGLQ